jgi:hypothetical protein
MWPYRLSKNPYYSEKAREKAARERVLRQKIGTTEAFCL